jgi:hypothetical protein
MDFLKTLMSVYQLPEPAKIDVLIGTDIMHSWG